MRMRSGRHTFLAGGASIVVADARQNVAYDPSVMFLVLDPEDARGHGWRRPASLDARVA
jgi:hypothetical protein